MGKRIVRVRKASKNPSLFTEAEQYKRFLREQQRRKFEREQRQRVRDEAFWEFVMEGVLY